jgi:uncharacterized integral membrane protein
MQRAAALTLSTIFFVLFAVSNTRRVALSFVVGETETGLIFLLLASFAAGAVTVFVRSTLLAVRRRADSERVRLEMKRALRAPEAD